VPEACAEARAARVQAVLREEDVKETG